MISLLIILFCTFQYCQGVETVGNTGGILLGLIFVVEGSIEVMWWSLLSYFKALEEMGEI